MNFYGFEIFEKNIKGGSNEVCVLYALSSPSASFIVLVFPLTPCDTWDFNYFESNLSLMLLVKVLPTKNNIKLFCSLLNMRKLYFLLSLFLCLSCISLRLWKKLRLSKNVMKIGGFGKNIKLGGGGGWGGLEWEAYRERSQIFCKLSYL